MDSMIYNPSEDFDKKYKSLHQDKTKAFFDELVKKSGVDIEANRKTVAEYDLCEATEKKLKKKLLLWRILRVLMIITVILIPVVIWKITPMIKAMREEFTHTDDRSNVLLAEAQRQMQPLNSLFSDGDALRIIESTIPLISFAPCFSATQEENMRVNYDFKCDGDGEESSVGVLAGEFNGNPFLFEDKLVHRMGTKIYDGFKVIHWTETYHDGDGHLHTRTRSQTLHATVTKPAPYYSNQVTLNYCAQGGPDLSFSRDATKLDKKSEKQIDKYVKRGEKKLKRMTDEAIKDNRDFVSMSNTDFEVLFDALDRTDEVQFRTLFTPLAQTNMVDLIRSQTGFGDDFNFVKEKRTNKITTDHSRGRDLFPKVSSYVSYSFDLIKEQFAEVNAAFFKALYFDLAPALAIPMYQERPVHSLNPIPEKPRTYAYKEFEAMANALDRSLVVHPETVTDPILKTSFVSSVGDLDEIEIHAFSYKTTPMVDFVMVLGGDGRMHSVAVPWDQYIPINRTTSFTVSPRELAENRHILAQRGNICIYNK